MSSLQDILNKLKAQDFGKDDSQIASTIMHPVDALSHFNNFLKTNMQSAGDAPMNIFGNPMQASDSIRSAINMAGLMQTGGTPFAPKSAGGVVGTIAVPTKNVTNNAVDALHKGATIEQLWQDLKVYPWKNDKGATTMLGEIPDTDARIVRSNYDGPLSGALQHPQLFEQHPNLSGMHAKLTNKNDAAYIGRFLPADNTIVVSSTNEQDQLSTLLHELTHAQQQSIGIPQGGIPSQFTKNDIAQHLSSIRIEEANFIKQLKEKYGTKTKKDYIEDDVKANELPQDYDNIVERLMRYHDAQHDPRFDLYQAMPGEIQARTVEQRSDYLPHELDNESPLVTMSNMGYPVRWTK